MAIPPTARAFAQALDPRDELDFYAFVSQGAPDQKPAPILLLGEGVASYSLALTAEAVAVGLRIMSGVNAAGEDRTDRLIGNELSIWFDVAPDMRGSRLFDGSGVTVGVKVNFRTTANPSRNKNRTFLLRIANQ